jgi:hypothetical protein
MHELQPSNNPQAFVSTAALLSSRLKDQADFLYQGYAGPLIDTGLTDLRQTQKFT